MSIEAPIDEGMTILVKICIVAEYATCTAFELGLGLFSRFEDGDLSSLLTMSNSC